MFIRIKIILVIFLFLPSLNAKNISVMSINAQNLFDTIDDPNKDDKAFLPIELKQSQIHKQECNNITVKRWRTECFFQDWNEETKNAKLNNLVTVIISYGSNGADVVGLQEIENINILGQLFQLLKPFGYIDFKLLESNDKRGVDTAFISRYKIKNPKLHYVNFSPSFETIDTRPIFEVDIEVGPNKVIKFYNVHFPSNWHPVQMRIESFGKLNDLINSHNQPAIALGDFNLNTKDDLKFNLYKDQEDLWYVAHREGCSSCKGTYYYGKGATWDFLDTIMISKDRGIKFDVESINVFKTDFNTYKDTGKPHWFNSKTKLGTSDHFPIVALINID
jgi:endonuclease/exonuclease/phosphatase family metal-dependent hydrolase